MIFNTSLLFFFIAFVLSPNLVSGQTIDTIYGCDELPALDSIFNCSICDDSPFWGTTLPYTPTIGGDWCVTIENDQFISFQSGPSGVLLMDIEVLSCADFEGMQVGIIDRDYNLYECMDIGAFGSQSLQVIVPPLTELFIRIDGISGDICEFTFTPVFGFNPLPPVVTVSNTSGETQINYLFSQCRRAGGSSGGDTLNGCVYSLDYEFQPSNSGFVQVQDLPNRYRENFFWAGNQPIRAQVDRVLTLIERINNSTCDSTLRFPYLSHFLDLDVFGSLAQGEIWGCDDNRIAYELEPEFLQNFKLFEGGSQRYVLEAAGLARSYPGISGDQYFEYEVLQNNQRLYEGTFTLVDFSDTFNLNFDNGIATVQLFNPFRTPLEYAFTRLDSVTPWVPEFSCSQSSIEVCAGEDLEATCSLSNAPCVTNTSCYQGISSIEEAQLFAQGSNTPLGVSINTSLSPTGEVSLLLDQQSISTLDTGLYQARLTLGIDQSFGGFCADSDTTSLSINFEVISSRDTIVLDTLELVPGTDLTIFQDAPINSPQVVTSIGDYATIVACTLYIQPVISSVVVELETIEVCPNECAYAPTGELITCTPGPFTFQASNDTTYTGELIIDNASPLEITSLEYTCDSLTGEWYLDLTWMGSYGPYLFDGQTTADSSGQAGPYQNGATIDISLAGASICVDTIFINGSFTCTSSTASIKELGFEVRQLSTSLLEVNAPSYGWNLKLIDVLGREVYNTPLQGDANQIAVDHLLPGTYFLMVQNGSRRASEKWVKR